MKKGAMTLVSLMVLSFFIISGSYLYPDDSRLSYAQGRNIKQSAEAFPHSMEMRFMYIRPGTFMMGSPSLEGGRSDNEGPQHQVNITKGFYMGVTEVTQGQWRAIMDNNPSHFKNCGDDCPVEQVSWDDVQEFIRRLNQKEGSEKYRLPTEAEWEYAARAGSTTRYSFGNAEIMLGEYGWYNGNSGFKTQVVAQKMPNAWGLYDMHGNVWEWVQDIYSPIAYEQHSPDDPLYTGSGSGPVFRGGSWISPGSYCRSAHRSYFSQGSPYLGFRLVKIP